MAKNNKLSQLSKFGISALLAATLSGGVFAQKCEPHKVFTDKYKKILKEDTSQGKISLNVDEINNSKKELGMEMSEKRDGGQYVTDRDFLLKFKKMKYLVCYSNALLEDDLDKAGKCLKTQNTHGPAIAPYISKLEKDLLIRKQNKKWRLRQELENPESFEKVVDVFLKKDSVNSEKFKNHYEELIKFAEEREIEYNHLSRGLAKIFKKSLEEKASFNLKKTLGSKRRFDKHIENKLQSKNLEGMVEARKFVDTCRMYNQLDKKISESFFKNLFSWNSVNSEYLSLSTKQLDVLIAKEKNQIRKDSLQDKSELVIEREYMPMNQKNYPGIYAYEEGFVIISNIPLEQLNGRSPSFYSRDLNLQFIEAAKNTNNRLRRKLANYDPKKNKLDVSDLRAIPYFSKKRGKEIMFRTQKGYQVRVYYDELYSQRYTKKFIEDNGLKEVNFNENVEGFLGEKEYAGGTVQLYSNLRNTSLRYFRNDSAFYYGVGLDIEEFRDYLGSNSSNTPHLNSLNCYSKKGGSKEYFPEKFQNNSKKYYKSLYKKLVREFLKSPEIESSAAEQLRYIE